MVMIGRFAVLLLVGAAWAQQSHPVSGQRIFATPQEAAEALVNAASANDAATLRALYGPAGQEIIESGDPAQDEARRQRFAMKAKESMRVAEDPFEPGRWIISVGKDNWPLPIPIVKVKGGYRFDIQAAKGEILARRVGANELDAIALLRALADAEVEFAYSDVDGNGMRDYAQKILSTPGKRDGLYWPAKEGAGECPLNKAAGDDIFAGDQLPASGQPLTFRGYVFRVLTAQGPNASGGARDYVVRGDMIGGFAFIAYPAEYGVSGIKTFVVNQDGVVLEKDLGANTKTIAGAIKRYNPDKTWTESPRLAE